MEGVPGDLEEPAAARLGPVLDELPLGQGEARSHLARFLFRGDDVFKEVSVLSGGERGRLALACLAPGLLMFSMNNILARAFFALDDIKTPMKISMVCLGLNLVFAVWLVHPYHAAGLGVANTLSATLNLALLVYALRRKLSRLDLTAVVNMLLVLVPDAILAGVVAAALGWFWEKHVGHATLELKLGMVFVPGGVAVLVYWLVALWLGVSAAREMTDFVQQRLRRLAKG
jgi:putative peptidoglycan lipid II flippase